MAHSKKNTDAYFQRLNSCISIPQDEILVALREDNLRLFSDLINEDDLDLNYEYKEENHSTLLHLCLTVSYVMSRTKLIFLRIFQKYEMTYVLLNDCQNKAIVNHSITFKDIFLQSENVKYRQLEYVEVLLSRGANMNLPHRILSKYPLHSKFFHIFKQMYYVLHDTVSIISLLLKLLRKTAFGRLLEYSWTLVLTLMSKWKMDPLHCILVSSSIFTQMYRD